MAFTLYTDSNMTHEAASPYPIDFNGTGTNDFVLYFGSPYTHETLTPKTGEIMLIPFSRLKAWQPEQNYSFGQIIEPPVANGYMYQCVQAGQTGKTEPVWGIAVNKQCTSGSARFTNLGAKFKAADLKLSLTQQGLETAIGGAALGLGNQLQGGKAIPVYIRVSNSDKSARSDRSDPCISIRLSETMLDTIVQSGHP